MKTSLFLYLNRYFLKPFGFTGIILTSICSHIDAQTLEKGNAQVYPTSFHGRKTASNETYDKNKRSAAHKTLPLGTRIEVTNIQNNKKTTVIINDRGPYIKGAIIELSSKAAKELQITKDKKSIVSLRVLDRNSEEVATKPSSKTQEKTTQHAKQLNEAVQQYENGGLYKMQVLPIDKKGFGVQVAGYTDYEAVLKQIAVLQDNWFKGSMVYVDQLNGKTIYKVILGPLFNRNEAESYCKNIRKKYSISDAFVVDLSTLKK